MTRLTPYFWSRPFAHRGLHGEGRPENSLPAINAAVDAGYGIEIDVQPSSDGEAMVFHDYTLDRLTARSGRVDAYSVEELQTIKLNGSSVAIPTLADVLAFIPGRTPLLIEIKDQSEGFTQTDCALERRVCEILSQAALVHTCAIMSFNPFVAKHVREALPEIARGVVSYDFEHEHDAAIPADHRADLASLKWVEETEVDFVSYGAGSLPTARTDALRAAGIPIFCWTIRSAEQAATALQHCDQITFEGYRP